MAKTGFISYSSHQKEWAAGLHDLLERLIGKKRVFLDALSIDVGQSWVNRIQDGLAQADCILLVVTPESMASPRVEDEWQAVVENHPDWRRAGKLLLLELLEAPLPPFFEGVQRVDFSREAQSSFLDSLERLARSLGWNGQRAELDQLAKLVGVPHRPRQGMPTDLRKEFTNVLSAAIPERRDRNCLGVAFQLKNHALEGLGSPELAANAALVHVGGSRLGPTEALHWLDSFVKEFELESGELAERSSSLRNRLQECAENTRGLDDLFSYFRGVAANHRDLVPHFRDKAVSPVLDHVFVELDLAAEWSKQSSERHELPSGHLRLRQLIEFDPEAMPWVTRRWVVRGDPGAGKTTLLRHFAFQLATEGLKTRGTPRFVPVFASLPGFVGVKIELLAGIAHRARAAGASGDLGSTLDRQGKEGRLVILLDSLDEVPRSLRDEALSYLQGLSVRWPNSHIIVASRHIGYESPGSEFREVDVQPLGFERRREFLANWFSPDPNHPDFAQADETLAILSSQRSLWEIAGIPLYLTLLAILRSQNIPLSRKRADLYDDIFGLLLKGKHKTDAKQRIELPSQIALRTLLGELALALTRDEQIGEPLDELEQRLYHEDLASVLGSLRLQRRWSENPRQILLDLSDETGILGPYDGDEAPWRYWHKSFLEAFTAEALERWHEREGQDALIAHARSIQGDENRWAEPFALLAGRLEHPDTLVRELVSANPALGLRALATAEGINPDTIRHALRLSSNWTARRKVIEDVLETVADPERGIRLLGAIAAGTTSGNDLYFIGRALDAAGDTHPDLADLAASYRADLFKHLEDPEILFTSAARNKRAAEVTVGSIKYSAPENRESLHGRTGKSQGQFVLQGRSSPVGGRPITLWEYRRFDPSYTEGLPGSSPRSKPDMMSPVTRLTWYQASAFCSWLSQHGVAQRFGVGCILCSVQFLEENGWHKPPPAAPSWTGQASGTPSRRGGKRTEHEKRSADQGQATGSFSERFAQEIARMLRRHRYQIRRNLYEAGIDPDPHDVFISRPEENRPIESPILDPGGLYSWIHSYRVQARTRSIRERRWPRFSQAAEYLRRSWDSWRELYQCGFGKDPYRVSIEPPNGEKAEFTVSYDHAFRVAYPARADHLRESTTAPREQSEPSGFPYRESSRKRK